MKKLVTVVVVAALFVASLSAEKTLHLGLYLPLAPLSLVGASDDDVETEKVFTYGAGCSIDYTRIVEKGFTWKLDAGVAKIGTSDLLGSELDCGTDSYFGFGCGYSFIRTEKLTLTVTESIGFRAQLFNNSKMTGFSEEDVYIGGEKVGDEKVGMSAAMGYIADEVCLTYRFTPHAGVFADFGLFYVIGGGGVSDKIKIDVQSYKDYEQKLSVKGMWYGFVIQPKLGVSWTF